MPCMICSRRAAFWLISRPEVPRRLRCSPCRGHTARLRLQKPWLLRWLRACGPFGHAQYAVLDAPLGVVGVQLVWGGAGQGYVHLHMPGAHTRFKLHARALGVVAHAVIVVVLHLHGQLLGGKAVFVHDGAARVRHRDPLGTQLHGFFPPRIAPHCPKPTRAAR